MKKEQLHTKEGFTLLETLLASALFVVVITTTLGAVVYSTSSALRVSSRSQALFLAQEGLEALHAIRDSQNTLTDGTYGLDTTLAQWALSENPDILNEFTRTLTISTQPDGSQRAEATVVWNNGFRNYGSVELNTTFTSWQTP